MKHKTYKKDIPEKKWGIYNTRIKSFQFGICKDTPKAAYAALFRKIGHDAKKWRFEPRQLTKQDLAQMAMDQEAYRLRQLRKRH